MKRLFVVLFLCSFALVGVSQAQHHSSGSHSSGHHSSKSKNSANKSVHVRGYHRKDGTHVAPYDRSAPGTAQNSTSVIPSYRKNYLADGYSVHPSVQRDKQGKIKRSTAARAAFERQSPCPSTGKTKGSCPGYVVDHVRALECGGADDPSNMQWQTVAAAKEKDKMEGNCR